MPSIKDVNIPVVMVATIVVFTLSGAFTVDYRYAVAENVNKSFADIQNEMQQGRVQEAINNDRLWVELLEERLKRADTEDERNKILRQIHRLEQSIEVNMGKIK